MQAFCYHCHSNYYIEGIASTEQTNPISPFSRIEVSGNTHSALDSLLLRSNNHDCRGQSDSA